ncbi:hypothetical protein KEH56_36545 [Burkholderia cenocepacia]|uniref:hypothetical protein n=1 Tax=Burkholderia cenocepacia TaxID=95486 RepID=UPI001BA50FFD|nr:hypothetical protein [Burkholderia cenocepacia]QUN44682.1 hypothetical protein KEH56_36545 [Burkholderia cenocepacia]
MNTVLAGVTVVRQDVVIPGARFEEVRAEQNSQPVSLLADHVRRAWQVNRDHRVASGIERVMLQCVRQRNGEYDETDRAKLDGIDVFINLTGLKCRSAESWIKDVLVNAADEPWTIEPTPIPELPDDLKSQVVDMVKAEVLARGYVDALQIPRARKGTQSDRDARNPAARGRRVRPDDGEDQRPASTRRLARDFRTVPVGHRDLPGGRHESPGHPQSPLAALGRQPDRHDDRSNHGLRAGVSA